MGIRDVLHLGHREPRQAPDPNHPHEFRRLSDNWLGHGVAPVRGPGRVDAKIVGAAMRCTGQQCGVCRRAGATAGTTAVADRRSASRTGPGPVRPPVRAA